MIVVSTRFGIFKPIIGGMLLTLAGTYVFNYSEVKWIWFAANIGTGITWNFVISHLLGMCARFDGPVRPQCGVDSPPKWA